MSTKSTTNKASYTRHGAKYKQENLRLAGQLDVAKAARKFNTKAARALVPLGYIWRSSLTGFPGKSWVGPSADG